MFRLIDRYLLREVLPYVILSFVLLTAIIFAQQASRFSELLVASSRSGQPLQDVWRLMSALIPGIVVITLPISLLIGSLVGLGRLSGDSEIVAMGASGISRLQILKSIGALALVVSAVMGYLTFTVMPRAIHNLKDLKAYQSFLFQGLRAHIKPRVFDESIPHKVLYVEDIDRATNRWHNIFLVDLSDNPDEPRIMTADEGYLREGEQRSANGQDTDALELLLENGSLHQLTEQSDSKSGEKGRKGGKKDKSAGDQGKTKTGGEPTRNQPPNYTVETYQEMTIGMEQSQRQEAETVGVNTDQESVEEMPFSKLIAYKPSASDRRVWLAEIHQRLAFPAACLVFAVLAVAFGISHVRTGRSFGLILGLAITIAYYLLALSGKHNGVVGKVPVWLGIWQANIILGLLGAFVLWLQRRPGWDPLSALSSLQHIIRRRRAQAEARQQSSGEAAAVTGETVADAVNSGDARARTRGKKSAGVSRPPQRVHRHRLIDRLVISDLTRFFFFILAGFSALFLIITLFQLLDAITRNNIEVSVVANYLLFLIPYIVNYMAPMAVLVAVMVTFGLLEKTSQVVVLKASGISIYRLAGPALVASLFLSGLVFLNQDYILPFTNRRQDNLYHLIRSGQEPAQTFYTNHKWIFGGDSRIYNYSHFNPIDDSFARLTVLSLSRQPFAITGRIFAKQARWDKASRSWVLQDGWERKFEGDKRDFQPFAERRISLPEGPDYFKRESKESSMMTLAELRNQIKNLARSGFDVLDLRIDLYKKLASPATCVIMMMVGLPFAFSVGKKGALYGVTLGIGIGLAYWGLLGLFEQMGRYEVLPPLLAAWGPNMMFGAGGLYLFLTSKT